METVELDALQGKLEGQFIPWTGWLQHQDLAIVDHGRQVDTLWISIGTHACLRIASSRSDLGLVQEGAQRKTVLRPEIARFCRSYIARMRDPLTLMPRGELVALVGRGDQAALDALWGLRPTNADLLVVLRTAADERVRSQAINYLSLTEEGMEIMLEQTGTQELFAAAYARRHDWSDCPRALGYLHSANPYQAALAVYVAGRRKGNLKTLVGLVAECSGPVKEALFAVLRQSELSDSLLLALCLVEGPQAEECLLLGMRSLLMGKKLDRLKASGSAALRKGAVKAEDRIRSYLAEIEERTRIQLLRSEAEVHQFLQDIAAACLAAEGRIARVLERAQELAPELAAAQPSSWRTWRAVQDIPSMSYQVELLRAFLSEFYQHWRLRWKALEGAYPDALRRVGGKLAVALLMGAAPDTFPSLKEAVEAFDESYAAALERTRATGAS